MPVADVRSNESHLRLLEDWMKSYRPWELFDSSGAVQEHIRNLAPSGHRRMGSNPHTNGGVLRRDLLSLRLKAWCPSTCLAPPNTRTRIPSVRSSVI